MTHFCEWPARSSDRSTSDSKTTNLRETFCKQTGTGTMQLKN